MVTGQEQVDGSRCVGGCFAERLPHQVWQTAHYVDLEVCFRNRSEHGIVVLFLIGSLVLLLAPPSAGEGNDWAMCQKGVAEARCEVCGADSLGGTNARAA